STAIPDNSLIVGSPLESTSGAGNAPPQKHERNRGPLQPLQPLQPPQLPQLPQLDRDKH
ncbi:MAG: hypothetical protein ACI9X4_002224, partial [Glaciecola sp.]